MIEAPVTSSGHAYVEFVSARQLRHKMRRKVDESLIIPEDALRWRLPPDPSVGRADPTLGGFTTELSLDTTSCPGLNSQQRQRIRDRARPRRTDDIIVSIAGGVITVKVDYVFFPPESMRVARDCLAAVLHDALAP